jgi:hypothetical protein
LVSFLGFSWSLTYTVCGLWRILVG